jgi:hypothetical protein
MYSISEVGRNVVLEITALLLNIIHERLHGVQLKVPYKILTLVLGESGWIHVPDTSFQGRESYE